MPAAQSNSGGTKCADALGLSRLQSQFDLIASTSASVGSIRANTEEILRPPDDAQKQI
jgi:hypothetical protein